MKSVLIECGECDHSAVLDEDRFAEMIGDDLSIKTVSKLFPRLRCSKCGSRTIFIKDERERVIIDPRDIVSCKSCGLPIPLPRLAAMPGTNICPSCAIEGVKPQPQAAYPQPPDDMRECPRCGLPTVVRQNEEDRNYFIGCTGFPKCRWTCPLDVD